jgi:uncharacterized lipoprotein YmbA
MNNVRTIGSVAGCAVAIAIGGCSSGSTRIYTLAPAAPASHIEVHHAPALRVDTLNVPASWDRIEILRPSAGGSLQLSDFDHWAAPLPQMARQALSEDLDLRLPPGSLIYPRLPKPSNALGVDIDILDFNIVGSQATMQASWTIVPSGDAQGAKRNAASLRSTMSSADPAAVAHAWSDLIGQLADHVAADTTSFELR